MTAQAAPAPATGIRKVVGASLVGTTVEWYDFFLYLSAAALVFDKLFFPDVDEGTGTLLAFATAAVGFVARPLGGLVFGHYGDKLGRKKLLVASLLLMGIATFAIGLLPTYATIGVAAPVLLVVLRLAQGFAVGGEWGGAVLLVSEHSDPRRRGFWTSWPQAGVPAGNLLATAVLAVLAAVQPDDAFESWGWRVPFLLSAVLVLLGLWIRLSVSETPLFREAQERAERRLAESGTAEKAPILQVVVHYWREVLVAMGARFAENVSYYVITTFLIVYVTDHLGMDSGVALNAALIASVFHLLSIPLWGALSDRVGRRPVYLLGAAGIGLWSFAFFRLLDTESFPVIVLAVTVGLVLHGAMYGPQSAFFSELFGTKVRYSGVSIGYQLASIVAGGIAPMIALALLNRYGSGTPVALYLLASSVVTVVAVALAGETRNADMGADDAVDVTAPVQTTAADVSARDGVPTR